MNAHSHFTPVDACKWSAFCRILSLCTLCCMLLYLPRNSLPQIELGIGIGLTKPYRQEPTFELLSKHGEEDGEVDCSRGLIHHVLQLLILHIETSCQAHIQINPPSQT